MALPGIINKVHRFLTRIKIFPTDPFGNVILLKRILIGVLGAVTYSRINIANKTKIEGTEYLKDLPNKGVLFLSNHQTYFADVIVFYHIFCSIKWGFKNNINFPIYLLNPRANNYYVAASETMNEGGFIPKLFSYAGAVTVERSWRSKGKNVNRGVDTQGQDKIGQALNFGWLVSFPQGTTTPFAPIRKGTAFLIKEYQPIVVPVVINGFRRAFDKKGMFLKKRDSILSVKFKKPIHFDESQSIDAIVDEVREIIEQAP
jgi:1-acyl-sn-glycerol-3-phosphate acyltransferase